MEIERCPYCRSDRVLFLDYEPFRCVVCTDCNAQGPNSATFRSPIEEWNRVARIVREHADE